MRITSAAFLGGAFLGAFLALSETGYSQESAAPLNRDNPPFVSLSLIGSDVVFSPDRVRFSFTADPGSYVTVFLISPSGRRFVLNPYQRAIAGSDRQVLIREATIGFETGESYIVAMVTRNASHSAKLVRQAQTAGRLASANIGAEASLNELLTAIMPIAGDDFTATYVSFRVISRGIRQPYAYAARCYGSTLVQGNAYVDDDFYIRRSLEGARFDALADPDPLLYSMNLPYLSACRGGLFTRAMLIARAPSPSVPIARRDSGAVGDSAKTPVDGQGIKHPVIPTPIGTSPFRENARPVMAERGDPVAPIIAPPLRVNPIDGGERERRQPFNEPTNRIDPQEPSPVVTPPQLAPPPSPSPTFKPTPLPAPVNPPTNPLTIPPADR